MVAASPEGCLQVGADTCGVLFFDLRHRLLEREGERLREVPVDAVHLVRPDHPILRDRPLPIPDLRCLLDLG